MTTATDRIKRNAKLLASARNESEYVARLDELTIDPAYDYREFKKTENLAVKMFKEKMKKSVKK